MKHFAGVNTFLTCLSLSLLVGCGGGAAIVPTSYSSYNAKDGSFACDTPDGWDIKGGGRSGTPVWAKFASGSALIHFKVEFHQPFGQCRAQWTESSCERNSITRSGRTATRRCDQAGRARLRRLHRDCRPNRHELRSRPRADERVHLHDLVWIEHAWLPNLDHRLRSRRERVLHLSRGRMENGNAGVRQSASVDRARRRRVVRREKYFVTSVTNSSALLLSQREFPRFLQLSKVTTWLENRLNLHKPNPV